MHDDGVTHRADERMKHYNSALYALYDKPTIMLCDDGRIALMFKCMRPGCRRKTRVNRYESHLKRSDNTSTSGLRHHTISCWGVAKVKQVLAAKTKVTAEKYVRQTKQGNLTFLFGAGKGKKFTFSFKNHTALEVRCVSARGYHNSDC